MHIVQKLVRNTSRSEVKGSLSSGSYVILNINFQTFPRFFPDLTFLIDIPRLNTCTIIVDMTKVKLSLLSKMSQCNIMKMHVKLSSLENWFFFPY